MGARHTVGLPRVSKMRRRMIDRPDISQPLEYEERNGFYLLLHSNRPLWTAVNRMGLEIARLCDGSRSVDDIVALIAARYAQEPERVGKDVRLYLEQLERAGFLNHEQATAAVADPGTLPPRLYLNVTERCNLQCVHCAVTGLPAPADGLSTPDILALVDDLCAMGGESLTLSGGEPLLRRDLLDILSYAAPRVPTFLATNGTLIDDDLAAGLSRLKLRIQISLDGASAEVHDAIRGPGTFERTMHGIDLLRRHHFAGQLLLNMTVMRANLDDVFNLLCLGDQMGIDVRLVPLLKLGRAGLAWREMYVPPQEQAELHTRIYRERRRFKIAIDGGFQGLILNPPAHGMWCRVGSSAAIDSLGNVYPCSSLMRPGFCLGSVHEAPLHNIMASLKLRGLAGFCAVRKSLIPACGACHWRHFCQSNCPAVVLAEKGTMLATDELCSFRQQFYPQFLLDQVEQRRSGPVGEQMMQAL